MYRVLIVDDEPEIRQGLRLKADWESLGLTIAGEAGNGVEALERLAAEAIDLVIADMNMPVMDGVSLLEACREQYPQLRVIVITGYEDFHYARAAVRTQARDYLLKPVARDELTDALRKVVQELERERNARNEQETVQWRLSQYYKEMKEHFLLQLARETPGPERALLERSRLFELEAWNERPVRFVTAGLRPKGDASPDDERTPDKLRLPFELICREFAANCGQPVAAFRDPNHPGLLHFVLADEGDAVPAFARELSDCVARLLSFTPSLAVGSQVTGFASWRDGYVSALLAWNVPASASEVGRASFAEASEGKAALSDDTVKVIQRQLLRGELDSFTQVVRKELTKAHAESPGQFVKLIFQLYLLLDGIAAAAAVPLDSGDQLWVQPDMALSLDTVGKAEAFLVRLGRKIQSKAAAETEDRDLSIVQAAKQFIDASYMYDLNLTLLAERFNYNPSYFSELFKAKLGVTFIHYLTEVRMNHAVRLLEETELGLWDIAELTGFSSASYFSSKFKKLHGLSPSEYRQRPSPEKFNNEQPKK